MRIIDTYIIDYPLYGLCKLHSTNSKGIIGKQEWYIEYLPCQFTEVEYSDIRQYIK